MKMHRFLALGALAVVLALFAACGGDEDPTPTPRPAAQPTPTPTAEAMMEEKPTPTAEAMMEEKPTPTPEAMTEQPTPTAAPRPTPTPVPPPPGFDAEEYFGGKTIRIITGTSPGGGYDTFSRIVAATAERYFPESTRFIVQNLPGAGQLRGLRAVLNCRAGRPTPSAPSTRAGSHGSCSWVTWTGSTFDKHLHPRLPDVHHRRGRLLPRQELRLVLAGSVGQGTSPSRVGSVGTGQRALPSSS